MDIETADGVWEGALEIRQEGRRPVLTGRFPYGALATVRDRGRVRKERFSPHAFRYAIEVAQPLQDIFNEAIEDLQRRQIDLLVGHSYNRPLASTRTGTLVLAESREAVEFSATLPPLASQPTWVQDAVHSVQGELMQGVSPGFSVPPANVVANAQELIPEPGNPDVMIRQIHQAVLHEFSLVTRPAYRESTVALRALFGSGEGEGEAVETRGDTLARLIRQLRDDREITNADLAAAGGIDVSTVRQILSLTDNQIGCPPVERLQGFARALDVPLARLMDAASADGCEYASSEARAALWL